MPPYDGRFWAYSKANIKQFAKTGNLIHRKTGMPRLVQYSGEMPGIPPQDVWDDISPAMGAEDLGYPTQKPLALLKRIVTVSSNPGDLVLDPFCGCGTTIDAAQELGRSWIGIDITNHAIGQIRCRLRNRFGPAIMEAFTVEGEPTSAADARALAEQDRFQFEAWALSLVGARLVQKKKGSDKGIDGRLFFSNGDDQHMVLSVKSGKPSVVDVRDLRGVSNERQRRLACC